MVDTFAAWGGHGSGGDAMKKFRFTGPDIAADIRAKYGYDGDLLQLYAENSDAQVHKWHHYIPLYDRYFTSYRNRPIRFLEIGVSRGGSLNLWRQYFGPAAVMFGIDINPDCATYNGRSAQVRIGSQADPVFLNRTVDEMGGIDIVLDDGSHQMDHVRASLDVLFPRLSDGGVYMIEDIHTAYARAYGGGLTAKGNFFADVRGMIDDMHHWYHRGPAGNAARAATISGLHVHDSIVVIDKSAVYPPTHSRVGVP